MGSPKRREHAANSPRRKGTHARRTQRHEGVQRPSCLTMVQNGVSRSAGKNAVDTATSKAKRPSRRGLQGSADQRLRRTPGRRHTFRTNEMTDISLRMQPVQSAAPRHVNADVMSRSPLSPPDRQKYGRLTEGYFPAERLRPCGKYNRDSRNGKSVKSPRILPHERYGREKSSRRGGIAL